MLVRLAAFFIVLIGIIVTAPLWLGALLLIGPTIPAILVTFVLVLGGVFVNGVLVQPYMAERAMKRLSCRKCDAQPWEPCSDMEPHRYHLSRMKDAGLVPWYFSET